MHKTQKHTTEVLRAFRILSKTYIITAGKYIAIKIMDMKKQ